MSLVVGVGECAAGHRTKMRADGNGGQIPFIRIFHLVPILTEHQFVPVNRNERRRLRGLEATVKENGRDKDFFLILRLLRGCEQEAVPAVNEH